MSDVKNWVFLILVINLILLPAMWLAQTKTTGGQVLGARETAATASDQTEPQVQNKTSAGFSLNDWIGENILNSGIKPRTDNTTIDLKSINSDLPLRTRVNADTEAKSLSGKVVVREGFKGTLAAKSFTVGDRVTLKCGDKVTLTSVDTTILSGDAVIGVASDALFLRLGADPSVTKELQCVISKV